MAHQEQGYIRILLCQMFPKVLYVSELRRPVCLSVCTILALMLCVQCSPTVASQVEGKDGDAPRGVLDVDMFIATNMFCESVHEENDGLWEGGWVGPRVELMVAWASEPCFYEVFSGDGLHIHYPVVEKRSRVVRRRRMNKLFKLCQGLTSSRASELEWQQHN